MRRSPRALSQPTSPGSRGTREAPACSRPRAWHSPARAEAHFTFPGPLPREAVPLWPLRSSPGRNSSLEGRGAEAAGGAPRTGTGGSVRGLLTASSLPLQAQVLGLTQSCLPLVHKPADQPWVPHPALGSLSPSTGLAFCSLIPLPSLLPAANVPLTSQSLGLELSLWREVAATFG